MVALRALPPAAALPQVLLTAEVLLAWPTLVAERGCGPPPGAPGALKPRRGLRGLWDAILAGGTLTGGHTGGISSAIGGSLGDVNMWERLLDLAIDAAIGSEEARRATAMALEASAASAARAAEAEEEAELGDGALFTSTLPRAAGPIKVQGIIGGKAGRFVPQAENELSLAGTANFARARTPRGGDDHDDDGARVGGAKPGGTRPPSRAGSAAGSVRSDRSAPGSARSGGRSSASSLSRTSSQGPSRPTSGRDPAAGPSRPTSGRDAAAGLARSSTLRAASASVAGFVRTPRALARGGGGSGGGSFGGGLLSRSASARGRSRFAGGSVTPRVGMILSMPGPVVEAFQGGEDAAPGTDGAPAASLLTRSGSGRFTRTGSFGLNASLGNSARAAIGLGGLGSLSESSPAVGGPIAITRAGSFGVASGSMTVTATNSPGLTRSNSGLGGPMVSPILTRSNSGVAFSGAPPMLMRSDSWVGLGASGGPALTRTDSSSGGPQLMRVDSGARRPLKSALRKPGSTSGLSIAAAAAAAVAAVDRATSETSVTIVAGPPAALTRALSISSVGSAGAAAAGGPSLSRRTSFAVKEEGAADEDEHAGYDEGSDGRATPQPRMVMSRSLSRSGKLGGFGSLARRSVGPAGGPLTWLVPGGGSAALSRSSSFGGAVGQDEKAGQQEEEDKAGQYVLPERQEEEERGEKREEPAKVEEEPEGVRAEERAVAFRQLQSENEEGRRQKVADVQAASGAGEGPSRQSGPRLQRQMSLEQLVAQVSTLPRELQRGGG